MSKLSLAIITLNNEKTIQDCLSSASFADEIIIVDGESSDRTIVLCHPYTGKIFVRPLTDYVSQVQYALQNCSHEWILLLFADERVRPELATEITDLMSRQTDLDGFFIARRSYFLNKWIRYCGKYPDYRFRLVRKESVVVQGAKGQGILHSKGRTGKLKYDLDYNSHPSLHDSLAGMDRKTTQDALTMINSKKVHWYHFVFPPLGIFLHKYFIQQGFRAGLPGFLYCWFLSFSQMTLNMKIWLLQHPVQGNAGDNR